MFRSEQQRSLSGEQPPLATRESVINTWGSRLGLAAVVTSLAASAPANIATAQDTLSASPHGEPIEVTIASETKNGRRLVIPAGAFEVQIACDGETKTTSYVSTPQLVGQCPEGSKVKITDIVPDDQMGNETHQLWQVNGKNATQTFEVGSRAVKATFTNTRSSLKSAGIKFAVGQYYYYAGGYYRSPAIGAEADIEQADPVLKGGDYHSAAELSVQSPQGGIIEVGWAVSPSLNGDNLPHLFVGDWVNGQFACLNGCGFVEVPNPGNIEPGDPVTAGAVANYKVVFANGVWDVDYNNNEIGYFTETIWKGDFTSLMAEQAFGEVESTSVSAPCSQMGNGLPGSSKGSTTISNFKPLNGAGRQPKTASSKLEIMVSAPAWYNAGDISADGFSFGGPGASSAASCNP